MRVDPDNRLVAESLEAEWNERLRALAEAHDEYARRQQQDARVLSDDQRNALLALASDFPRLWTDLGTADRDRKRMVRLLLEDVTLNRDEQISLQIRFKRRTQDAASATALVLLAAAGHAAYGDRRDRSPA